MSDPVKTARPYDATGRRDRARQGRERVIEVGSRLFLVHGYAGTTVRAIADQALVSEETIYKSFGGKPGLLRAIWARALEGDGPIPAEQRSDAMRSTVQDPREVIRNWGLFITEVAPRVAPVLLLIKSAASSDPQLAALLAEVEEQRLGRMERNALTLQERQQLRPDMTLQAARDVLWAYSSPELFDLLVQRRGWPVEDFATFVSDQLVSALLPPQRSTETSPPSMPVR